jgi:hypothetical protein
MSTATEQEPITGELIEAGLKHAPIVYHVSDAKITELRKEFAGMKIATSGDYEKVTKAIAVCRTLRVQVDKCRKDLKEDALTYGRRVDAEAKRLTEALEAIENPLKAENQRVDEEKERLKREAEIAKQKQLDERLDQLAAVNARVAPRIVAGWSEEEFQKELAEVRRLFDLAKEAERQQREEAERKAAEAKAAEEAERLAREEALRIERERLDKEREAMRLERLKLEQEKAEAERLAAIERAKVAESQRIERERLEAERAAIQAEKDRLEREQFERDEAERLKREELQRQEDAEKEAVRLELLQAEEERAAAAREAKERERLEALKPDREKFNAIAQSIRKLASEFPAVSNSESQHYLDAIVRRLKDTADFCEECLES